MLDPSQVLNEAVDLHRKGDLAAAESRYLQLIKARSDHFDALHLLGILRCQQGQFSDALPLIGAALRANPDFPPALLNYGLALDALKRRQEALATYDKALAIQPNYAEAHYNRGVVLRSLKRPAEALTSFERALSIRPDYAEALYHGGMALMDLQRPAEALAGFERALAVKPDLVDALIMRGIVLQGMRRSAEALASYETALAIKPGHAEALNNRGLALLDLQRPADALASFDQALAARPDYAVALNNRGNTLQDLKRPAEALASYDRALAIQPDYAQALYNRGVVLRDLQRPAEALANFDQALSLKPDYVDALNNRGVVLRELKRPAEALASYDRALAIRPDYVEALNNRGSALRDMKRPAEALASHDLALAIEPHHADALCNRGIALRELKRPAEALASFDRALAIKPDHRYAFAGVAYAALATCDWARAEIIAGELERRIAQDSANIAPFTLLGYSNDQSLLLQSARKSLAEELPVPAQPLWHGKSRHHDRLRIVYLSADFRRHAVASLIVQLFELHDRARFEIVGVSFGPDDQSDMRARIVRGFDRFHDVRSQGDGDVAQLLSDMEIDIAVDLNGRTEESRLGILARRPAPVQATYLGYPGTTGADFIDYVIADKTVLPLDQQPFYSERIVHLPECYQVNDSTRKIAANAPTRREAGLPDDGFVFCCFNNNYKITAPVFDVWMRLMGRVEGSVLWLLQDAAARANLSRAAAARGIDPARLVFAGMREPEEHLARHRLADLFLDTLPYNAHTTASDALWAGLPVLTCEGAGFAGRVAASLLRASGHPELVTGDLHEYESLGLRLATEPALLRAFRQRLEQNRSSCPLFDTDRSRRHIESAYSTMWEIHQRGESPRSFGVEPLDGAAEEGRP
jgi:predicted O-linked N-acetylglucosamine transferase (SPINDLY family)